MTPAMVRLRRQLVKAVETAAAGGKPVVPDGGILLWQCFRDLNATRSNGFGPGPISYLEIDAYLRLIGMSLQAHHIKILRLMDEAWLRKDHAGPSRSSGPAPSITPNAFDAVFS